MRLRRREDFARVRRSGAVYRDRDIFISVCRSDLTHNRYGIVTSRRLGKAVARNKCRRRLRAILARLHDGLRQGFDVVVIARPSLVRQPFDEMQRILCGLLRQAQLMGNC